MDIIGLIKNALLALTVYLELKNKAFFYDISEKSRNKQKELVNEIETLRNSKSSSDHDHADLLLADLMEERAYSKTLSATYPISGKG